MGLNNDKPDEKRLITFQEKQLWMNPRVIPAHLRLFSLIESKLEDGNYTQLESILGYPLYFPTIECKNFNWLQMFKSQSQHYQLYFSVYYKDKKMKDCSKKVKKFLGNWLLQTMNYIREALSALTRSPNSTEFKNKACYWFRIWNLIGLQKLLVRNLIHFSTLPPAYVTSNTGKINNI